MVCECVEKREYVCYKTISRFFFLVLLFCSVGLSRDDSVMTMVVSTGTEYFNIFQQSAEKSQTSIFSTDSYVSGMLTKEDDTLQLMFCSSKKFAAAGQKDSKTDFLFTTTLQTLHTLFKSRFYDFEYTVSLGYPLNSPSHPLFYGADISVDVWKKYLTMSTSWSRSLLNYNSTILFQDFFVPQNDVFPVMHSVAALLCQPLEHIAISARMFYQNGKSKYPMFDYGASVDVQTRGIEIEGKWQLNNENKIHLSYTRNELWLDVVFARDNQSFGEFSHGNGLHNRYELGGSTVLWSLPVSINYVYEELPFHANGQFESWPFTSLAASIIVNRFYYVASGFIKHHEVSIETTRKILTLNNHFMLSYYRVMPTAAIEHWEPEILVFGMKNYHRTPFSIRDGHFLKIGIQTEYPFGQITAKAFIEQYIPLSITYQSGPIQPPVTQPGEFVPSRKPSTDGGRRFGIMFVYAL